jgi:hypothetical protein
MPERASSERPPTPWPDPVWTVIGSSEALDRALAELRQADHAALALHLSVTGADAPTARLLEHDRRRGRVAFLALARDPERHQDRPSVLLFDPGQVELEPLLRWLTEPTAPYVVMYDAHAVVHRIAALLGGDPARPWAPARLGSIQAAAILLAQGDGGQREPPSLHACLERLLERRIESASLIGLSAGDAPRQALTAAEASTLLPMMQALTPMLRRRELTRIYGLECRLVPAVVAMERTGMGVDGAAFVRIAQGWERERQTTDDPARIARLDKLLSTYAHWPRDYVRRDRIHPLLHPLAADSGRFSCTDPNLQQVPSEHTAPGLRACFRPEHGTKLVVADYAQIELRVAAHLAPCDALRRVFAEGRDPHLATAATITGKPENAISGHERKLAKAVNFGFLFGMGARRFRSYAADSYGVELDDAAAQRAREAFLTTFPGIAAWHRRVGRLGRSGRPVTVRTVLGRRKRFPPERFSFNAALNIPVQGTAAEGFKLALVELHETLPRLGGHGVLCVHDEYIAEVPAQRADEARDLVVSTMRDAMACVVTSVPIEVQAHVTDHWG